MQTFLSKIIVFFVWVLIFTIGIVFSLLYLPQLYKKNFIIFIIVTILFIVSFLLTCISYARATCTQPGSPDNTLTQYYKNNNKLQQLKITTKYIQNKRKQRRQYYPTTINQQQLNEQIQQMKLQQYCQKCKLVRASRTHHCSICKKCIIRMDHHCPWTGNCIGLYNHKYFILFLMYATIGLAIVGFSIIIDWINNRYIMDAKIKDDWIIYLVSAIGIISIVLMLSIGFLFFTQMLGLMINLTTLESFTDGIQDKRPFDKGSIRQNMKDIFGMNINFLPIQPKWRFQGDREYQIQHHF